MSDSSQRKIAPRYHESNGIVWMKRNNHPVFTNSKYSSSSGRQVNSGFLGATTAGSIKPKMELDKGVPLHQDHQVARDQHADGAGGEDSEPSSYEESYSDQDIELNDEDVWDDSLLIKMYEASQKQINDELTRRFTGKTCDSSGEENNSNNNCATTSSFAGGGSKKPKHKLVSQKVPPKANSDSKPVLSKPMMNWKEGDFCQLTYLEDSVDYEAKIISINSGEQTCLVRYIGYENEEVRSLSDLKPSEGEKVRKLQIEMAIQDGYGGKVAEAGPEEPPTLRLQVNPPELSMLPKHLQGQAGAGGVPAMGTSRIIPPPAPFLNGESNLANNPTSAHLEDDEDVLASMLMSWYMTGYHTGYYQARKDMKNSNQ